MRPESSIESRLALRDRFFALSRGGASEEELRRFRDVVDATDFEAELELEGLRLSFHPTATFKALRFLPAELIDEAVRPLFARPSARMPQLAAAFVDPEELSFRTFENILPLDRWFDGVPLDLSLEKRAKLGEAKVVMGYVFALEAGEAARAALSGLDALDLYTSPLNAASRGGRRFIFHSSQLSEALTRAVREALPKRWSKGFSHVNPVFRCNRFEPGDAKFHRHVDTPYFDAARHHVSRFTMLIYLTGGRGEPALAIGDDIALDAIEPMTCVVFPQDLPHEGAAFTEDRKVFLRTELIFEDRSIVHEPSIARTFAKATYFTGESVFEPELARHAHQLYDRAAAAHWGEASPKPCAEPFVHKEFRGLHFVTNGYDFWFSKRAASLETCAAVALLDVFNCKVGGEAFRKQCRTEVLTESRPPASWVPAFLASRVEPPAEALFGELDVGVLFPEPEKEDGDICCPFHAFHIWDAARNPDTVDFYEKAQAFASRRIRAAPITIMGTEIFLDPAKFVVEAGKIHVLTGQSIPPVNFAACWNDESTPPNYVDVEATVGALQMLVPPILFVENEDHHHLMFDFFRNSWMVQHVAQAVPVPKIRHLSPHSWEESEESEATPWLDAAGRVEELARAEPSDAPWWSSEDSEILQDLYEREEE